MNFFILYTILFYMIQLLYGVVLQNAANLEEMTTCLTPKCIAKASDVVQNINSSINPCEDFFSYSCGSITKRTDICPDIITGEDFELISFRKLYILKKILVTSYRASPKHNITFHSQTYKKVEMYYHTCIDSFNNNNTYGLHFWNDVLRQMDLWDIDAFYNHYNGTAPANKVCFNNTQYGMEDWSFQEQLHNIAQKLFLSEVLPIRIVPDQKNNSIMKLVIGYAPLSLGLDIYQHLNESDNFNIFAEQIIHMIRIVFRLLESKKSYDNTLKENFIRQWVAECLISARNFEIELDKIGNESEAEAEIRNYINKIGHDMVEVLDLETLMASFTNDTLDEEETYTNITLGEMDQRFTSLNWSLLVQHLFSPINYTINSEQIVYVKSIEYLSKLNDLWTLYLKSAHTKSVLKNYLLWHLVKSVAFFQPYKMDAGINKWKDCIKNIEVFFPEIAGRLYVESEITVEKRNIVKTMMDNMKNSFEAMLHEYEWLDKDTREAAIDKLNKMKADIAYPEYIMNLDGIEKKYEILNLSAFNSFHNELMIVQFKRMQNLKMFVHGLDRSEVDISSSSSNAAYSGIFNLIVILAGSMQPPHFDTEIPMSLNYGSMGITIGHEIIHGFDSIGRKYDSDGNNRQWWTNTSLLHFDEKSECFIKQYNTIKLFESWGKSALRENMADNGGINVAFKAYMQNSTRDYLILPGVNLTDIQLFFLSSAQKYCQLPWGYLSQVANYAPNNYRAIIPLQNSREFSKAFNCPPNSPMNPKNKCILW